jgi:D-tyrosyl-tRNA(Tyr) deacylase
MRYVVQVVQNASVSIDDQIKSKIGYGELVLYSFKHGDNEAIVDKMIDKLLKLRIFPDGEGKTNLNISGVEGQILAVSQFTLYASLKEGNRPAFVDCMNANEARKLSEYFEKKIKEKYPDTQFGVFQADMKVSLLNDGPFSIILDSAELAYER